MYTAQNFEHLLGTEGFSDEILKNHFKLYEGYVKNANTLIEKLGELEKGSPEYNELKRRFGWEWNGMRLHEVYFGGMTKEPKEPSDSFKQKAADAYGSFEKWLEDFKKTGALRGIGWGLCVQDNENGKLFNIWSDEHDTGYLAGTTPIIAMDVFEHAFVLDYGMDRGAYIDAFCNAIDWETVEKRLG